MRLQREVADLSPTFSADIPILTFLELNILWPGGADASWRMRETKVAFISKRKGK